MSGSISPSEVDVTQPNIGGIMNLLNGGTAFVTSLVNDATSVQGSILNAAVAINTLPAGLISLTQQAQVTSLITQLNTLGTNLGNSLIVHLQAQVSNLTNNLSIAAAQSSAQIALLANGGTLPSCPPITAANPTGNMEAMFGSVLGLGGLLIDQITGQMSGITSLINQLDSAQITDVGSAINTLTTTINGVANSCAGAQNVVDSEIKALNSAISDMIFYSTATQLASIILHPCAQTMISSVGSQSLQDHVNLTGAEANPNTLTPLWAYPIAAAPAVVADFDLAPIPNQNALISGVVAPTFSSPPTADSLTFSWTNPVTGDPPWTFQPQYRVSGDDLWLSWGDPITGFTTTITGLDANTQYDAQVICSNHLGISTSPTIVAATASAIIGAPAPATDLTTGLIDTNSIQLSWTAPFGGDVPMVYQVRYRASGAYFWNNFGGPVSDTSIILIALNTNSPYDLQVVSINDVGSSISATLTTHTAGFQIIPENPTPLPTPVTSFPTTPSVGFPTNTLPLGTYVGDPSATDADQQTAFVKQFESFAAAMGRNPSLMNTNINSKLIPAEWAPLGAVPIVTAWRGTSFLQPGLMVPVLGLPMFSSGLIQPTVIVPSTPVPTTPRPTAPTTIPTNTPTRPTPTIPTAPLSPAPQLPAGPFLASGSQIVGADGSPVRILAVNWRGADLRHSAPIGLDQVNYTTLLSRVQGQGFNTVRILTNDISIFQNDSVTNVNTVLNPTLLGLNINQILLAIVSYCAVIGLRVIIDSHNNEGTGGIQANGLWYDYGGSTDNTDGNQTAGSISDSSFTEVWRTRATLFKGKTAILGYDIRNNPKAYSGMCTWGDAGINDLRAMYTRVGNAIQAIDPSPLIICAGPENFNSTFVGTGTAPEGDLTAVKNFPVSLNIPSKVMYSVHEYPNTVNGSAAGADNGAQYIARMQAAWGYLVTNKTAPVFIGECGTSMQDPTEKAWGATFLSFINGLASGGPTFSALQQGISIGWWDLEPLSGVGADQHGILTDWTASVFDPLQKTYWSQAQFTAKGNVSPTAPTLPTPTVPTVVPTVPPPTVLPSTPPPTVTPTPTVVTPTPTVAPTPTVPTPAVPTPTVPTAPTPTVVTPTPTTVPTPTVIGTTTFADEFDTLSLHRNWIAGDKWQLIAPDSVNGRGGPNWNEAGTQYWVNPYNPSTPISGIYAVSNSILALSLFPTPSAYAAWINNDAGATMPYVGALLNSSQTNYQRFGYYELSVAVDRIPGFAFQLDIENVQLTGHYPPEIDLIVHTDAANTQHLTFQIAIANSPSLIYTQSSTQGFDGTIFHTYGFNVQNDFITFYMDGAQLYQVGNPGGVYQTDKQFMYLVTYAAYPDAFNPPTAQLPAFAHLDYLRVYQNKPGTPSTPTAPTVPTVPTSPTVPTTQTTYITPGVGSFVDSAGNVYTLAVGGAAQKNGVAITGGAGTSAMELFGGIIYAQDANTLSWYTFDGTNFNGPVAAPPGVPTSPTTPAPTAPTAPTVPTTPGAQFKVVNGLIVDPNGNNFIARGINLYDNYTSLDPQTILNLFPGLNFIRLNCFSYTGVDSAASLQTFISKATTLKIVIEIEDHTGISAPPYTGSNLTKETAWYASCATAFKSNPYVWFGTFNEAANPTAGSLSAQHAAIYNAIRATGNTNPVMMCLISGGNPGTIGTGNGLISSTYTSMTNIIWDLHQYSWTTNYSTSVSTMKTFLLQQVSLAQQLRSGDGLVPVLIGEYGISTDGATNDPGGTQLCQAVQQSGYGNAAWGWNTGQTDNLTDGNGHLTSYGTQVAGWISS